MTTTTTIAIDTIATRTPAQDSAERRAATRLAVLHAEAVVLRSTRPAHKIQAPLLTILRALDAWGQGLPRLDLIALRGRAAAISERRATAEQLAQWALDGVAGQVAGGVELDAQAEAIDAEQQATACHAVCQAAAYAAAQEGEIREAAHLLGMELRHAYREPDGTEFDETAYDRHLAALSAYAATVAL